MTVRPSPYGSLMELRWPGPDLLDSYADALGRGWSPDTVRAEVSAEQLAAIANDPTAFLASLVDREAVGPPIPLPDGSFARRLPGFYKWMWDGAFCGSIGFRWQPGTADLPSHVLGHIGYSVVPWKRGLGCATTALGLMLDDAAAEGLPFVMLTTDIDNEASQRVIRANGGVAVEQFTKDAMYGGTCGVRFRIDLPPSRRAHPPIS